MGLLLWGRLLSRDAECRKVGAAWKPLTGQGDWRTQLSNWMWKRREKKKETGVGRMGCCD